MILNLVKSKTLKELLDKYSEISKVNDIRISDTLPVSVIIKFVSNLTSWIKKILKTKKFEQLIQLFKCLQYIFESLEEETLKLPFLHSEFPSKLGDLYKKSFNNFYSQLGNDNSYQVHKELLIIIEILSSLNHDSKRIMGGIFLIPLVKNLPTHTHNIKLQSRNAPEKLIHYVSILHFELDIINCLVERSAENKALISKKKENLIGELINLMAVIHDGQSQYLIAEIVYRSTMVGLPSKEVKLSVSKRLFNDKILANSFSSISNSKFNESMRNFLNTYNNNLHPSIRKIVSFKLDSLSIGRYKFNDPNSNIESNSPSKKVYKNKNLWLDVGFKNFCFWVKLENDEQFTFIPFSSVEGIQRRRKDVGNMKYEEVLIIIRIPLALIPSIFVNSLQDKTSDRIRLFLRLFRRDATKFERYVVSPILTNPDMSNISLGQFSDASLKETIKIKDEVKESSNLGEPMKNEQKVTKELKQRKKDSKKPVKDKSKEESNIESKVDSEIEKLVDLNKSTKRNLFSKHYRKLKNKLKKSNDNTSKKKAPTKHKESPEDCKEEEVELSTNNEDLKMHDEEYYDEGVARYSNKGDISHSNLEMSSVAVLYSPSPLSKIDRKRSYCDTNFDEEEYSFIPKINFENSLDGCEEHERVSYAFMDICRDENYNISPLKKSKYSPLELVNTIQTPLSPYQKGDRVKIRDTEKMEKITIEPRKLFQDEDKSQTNTHKPIDETIRSFGKEVKEDITLKNAQLESIMRNSLIQINQAGDIIQEQIQKVLSIQKEYESICKEYGNYVYQIFNEFETKVINEVEII